MVLEIKLSNFFSIGEEVILDLRAGKINTAKSRLLSDNIFQFKDTEVLKTAAIYGANASGKSNLIKAIRFCIAMVCQSHNHNEDSVFNFVPFKFGSFRKQASTFSIRFVHEAIEYEYSFSLTQTEILTESLYHYPHGRRAKVFARDESAGDSKKEKYSVGISVIRRPLDVAESTSRKTLFVSRASQMDREIPKRIFRFFSQSVIGGNPSYSIADISKLINLYKAPLLKALQMADSDIIDFKQKVKAEKGKNIRANMETQEAFFEDAIFASIEIKTYHRYASKVPFDFMTEESKGTKQLFFLMLIVLDVLKNNKTIFLDEIEDSLHPKIIDYLIKLFHASPGAQLIFSTHNTNLLDLNKFRKDQIWFVNKTDRGNSDLYSLYDYADFRDTMDLEKAYLQGRFDSIPIIDDSANSIQSIILS
ncbi:MAG: ATP-binding protein [Bacteroidota bacterium]